MDKGLSLLQAEDFLSNCSDYTDIIKLGFGTSIATPKQQEIIKLYQDAGMAVYFGGTLFEAFVIRNQFDDFVKLLEKYGVKHAEVSDGSINIKPR